MKQDTAHRLIYSRIGPLQGGLYIEKAECISGDGPRYWRQFKSRRALLNDIRAYQVDSGLPVTIRIR